LIEPATTGETGQSHSKRERKRIGIASKTLDPKAKLDKQQKNLAKAVTKLLTLSAE
jgi:enoyl-CoA hydratase/carnithine racemase